MNLRDLVPPIVFRIIRRRKDHAFKSFDAALAACGRGYEDRLLADVVFEKTKRYRDNLTRRPAEVELGSLRTLLAVLLARTGPTLNVIDFGGACGAHYFLARALLGDRINFQWHVVETPVMAERGRELEDGSLKFFSELSAARNALGEVHLVYSSGALQYVPDPYGTLTQLTAVGAAMIFFTRVGLTRLPDDLIVSQETRLSDNGPGPLPAGFADAVMKYPATFIRKAQFEAIVRAHYSLALIVDEGTQASAARGLPVDTYGYFGTRKD